MIQISEEIKEHFRKIVDQQNGPDINFINICLVKNRSRILSHLRVNDISFNIIVDKTGYTDLVDIKWKTNGGYKREPDIFCNPNVNCINIALLIDDKLDIREEAIQLKIKLKELAEKLDMKLVIGNNIHIINNANENDEVFEYVTSDYIADATFRYFRDLF